MPGPIGTFQYYKERANVQPNYASNSTVSLTAADSAHQIFTGTGGGINVDLPGPGIRAGDLIRIDATEETGALDIKASVGGAERPVGAFLNNVGTIIFQALVDNPSLGSHWLVLEARSSGKFVPGTTPLANCSSPSVVDPSFYVRVNNVIHVCGIVNSVNISSVSTVTKLIVNYPQGAYVAEISGCASVYDNTGGLSSHVTSGVCTGNDGSSFILQWNATPVSSSTSLWYSYAYRLY